MKIIKADLDWKLVKNICRGTNGKEFTDKEPSEKFIRDILIAEHTPIRVIRVTYVFDQIKSWVATHFARHNAGVDKWISTQRTDRTGINRDQLLQSAEVDEFMQVNAQGLINMSRQRLCYKASTETRWQMEELKDEIYKLDKNIAFVMVPACVYRGGCPEMETCRRFEEFTKACGTFTDIKKRYEAWEHWDAWRNGR